MKLLKLYKTYRISQIFLITILTLLNSSMVLAYIGSDSEVVISNKKTLQLKYVNDKSKKAVLNGLIYLQSIQNKDGSWALETTTNGWRLKVGITSLSVLAFLANGYLPGQWEYGSELKKAQKFLINQSSLKENGFMGNTMYEHGLATMCLAELLNKSPVKWKSEKVTDVLIKAIKLIELSQSDKGGWRYRPAPEQGEDTSVSAMVYMSLASAHKAGFNVNDRVSRYFKEYCLATGNPNGGGFWYNPIYKKNTTKPPHKSTTITLSCTAGGTYSAQLAGLGKTKLVKESIKFMKRQPDIFNQFDYFYYFHFYAIHAMAKAGENEFALWYPKIRNTLTLKQNKNGSWNNKKDHVNPMAILILSSPYNLSIIKESLDYLPTLKVREKEKKNIKKLVELLGHNSYIIRNSTEVKLKEMQNKNFKYFKKLINEQSDPEIIYRLKKIINAK